VEVSAMYLDYSVNHLPGLYRRAV